MTSPAIRAVPTPPAPDPARKMLGSLHFRLADVTGREAGEIRGDARSHRVLTVSETGRYGLAEVRARSP